MNASTFTESTSIASQVSSAGTIHSASCQPAVSVSITASTPFETLGAPISLSPKMVALKDKIFAVIQKHPGGIDAFDIARKVDSDTGTVNLLCQELEREGRVAGA